MSADYCEPYHLLQKEARKFADDPEAQARFQQQLPLLERIVSEWAQKGVRTEAELQLGAENVLKRAMLKPEAENLPARAQFYIEQEMRRMHVWLPGSQIIPHDGTGMEIPFLHRHFRDVWSFCCNRQRLLIGAGAAPKELIADLQQCEPEADLIGILLLHEHSTMLRGGRGVAREFGAPLLGTEKVLRFRDFSDSLPTILLKQGEPLTLGPFTIQLFPVDYDAVDPSGAVIAVAGQKIGMVTDGKLPENAAPLLRKCTHLVFLNCRTPDLRFCQTQVKALRARFRSVYYTQEELQAWLIAHQITTPVIRMLEKY